SVSETPDAVRLRIQASGDIAPGSVEVRFAGRKAVVLARDAAGRAIRSHPVRLPAPVVEEGASADYDDEDALVMTLRKQSAAQAAAPPGDPEAAARRPLGVPVPAPGDPEAGGRRRLGVPVRR